MLYCRSPGRRADGISDKKGQVKMEANGLDPVFESIFPASERVYQETIRTLRASPITSLLQVGIIAPVIEEIWCYISLL